MKKTFITNLAASFSKSKVAETVTKVSKNLEPKEIMKIDIVLVASKKFMINISYSA